MRTYVVEGLLLAGLALVGIADGLASLSRKTFQIETLSPGWYLIAVALGLLVCASVYVAKERSRIAVRPDVGNLLTGPILAVWGSMAAYATLIPLLGFALATFLFFTAVFYLLGARSWFRTGMEGLAFAIGFYLSFVSLARVLMPAGWIGPIFERFW